MAFVWPQNPAGAYMQGVAKLIHRIDENSSGWEPGHGLLQPLFQRNRPWAEPGHLILAIGLVGKDADVRALAIDALIEGITGRLFDPQLFAQVVRGLCDGGWVKLNRLSSALAQAGAASPLHADLIGQALQGLGEGFDFTQLNAASLLEVLVEVQAQSARPLSPPLQATLKALSGGGKAAKLAKQLLAMAPAGQTATISPPRP
jgi:hypothetical protein